MGLEAATFISELVSTNPVGNVDNYSTTDDHLRLLKAVLQSQFPNFTAAAANPTIAEINKLAGLTATTAELNKVDGYTGNAADLDILAGAAAAGLTAAELLFVNGVTSGIQAQIDGKSATGHSHAAGDVTSGEFAVARIPNLTASKISDFDTEVSNNASVTANTAKVTNASHTGDVTGSGALTAQAALITGKSPLTAGLASTDELLVSDAGVLKRMDVSVLQTFLDATFLKSGDTPTTLNIGNADTTLSRISAGNLEVEGAPVLRHNDGAFTSGRIRVQNGGSPTGGSPGDIWLIW
jgi:hypothetical protein